MQPVKWKQRGMRLSYLFHQHGRHDCRFYQQEDPRVYSTENGTIGRHYTICERDQLCRRICSLIFGLMYFHRLLGLNNHRVANIFSKKSGHPALGAAILRNSFKFLVSHLGSMTSLCEQSVGKLIAAIRDFFGVFNGNCAQAFTSHWMKHFIS